MRELRLWWQIFQLRRMTHATAVKTIRALGRQLKAFNEEVGHLHGIASRHCENYRIRAEESQDAYWAGRRDEAGYFRDKLADVPLAVEVAPEVRDAELPASPSTAQGEP